MHVVIKKIIKTSKNIIFFYKNVVNELFLKTLIIFEIMCVLR